jgi:hypothetical protein
MALGGEGEPSGPGGPATGPKSASHLNAGVRLLVTKLKLAVDGFGLFPGGAADALGGKRALSICCKEAGPVGAAGIEGGGDTPGMRRFVAMLPVVTEGEVPSRAWRFSTSKIRPRSPSVYTHSPTTLVLGAVVLVLLLAAEPGSWAPLSKM